MAQEGVSADRRAIGRWKGLGGEVDANPLPRNGFPLSDPSSHL